MSEEKIGEVVKFFSKPCVAAVNITEGELSLGDTIRIMGHTTDFTMVVASMEKDNSKFDHAVAGDSVGIKVTDRARAGDEVYKVKAG